MRIVAHGLAGQADLPVPLWLFTWGAGVAVLLTYLWLRASWRRPRLRRRAEGRPLPRRFQTVTGPATVLGRCIGLFLFGVAFVAAWWGDELPTFNIAPVAVLAVFFVGMQLVSALVGDVYRALDPLDTLAAGIGALRPAERGADDPSRPSMGQWPAATGLASFVWLELAYHDPYSPRVVAVWLTLYSIAALTGAALWGRAWLRQGESFAALFGMLAHLAPLTGRRGDVRVRPPVSGLARMPVVSGTVAVLLVVIGAAVFDGVTGTTFWADVAGSRTGWSNTVVRTVGLGWITALVAGGWLAATWLVARATGGDQAVIAAAFAPLLVPIALAYTIAHYFPLLVIELQAAYALASDPLGRGWDLFGTASRVVDEAILSASTIAYIQVAAMVLGHVVATVFAFDRALEVEPRRLAEVRTYPMLGLIVVSAVGGLALFVGT